MSTGFGLIIPVVEEGSNMYDEAMNAWRWNYMRRSEVGFYEAVYRMPASWSFDYMDGLEWVCE